MPQPDDQLLAPIDKPYLQFLVTTNRLCSFLGHTYTMHLASNDLQIPIHRVMVPISSKPLRYAVLAHASFKKMGPDSIDTLRYLGQCYKCLHEAVAKSDFMDVVYTGFTLICLAIQLDEPVETMLSHIWGVCRSLQRLDGTTSELTLEEWFWMREIWQEIFTRIFVRLSRLRYQDWAALTSHIEKINDLLEASAGFLLEQNLDRQVPMMRDAIWQRVKVLGVYMQYYFSYYLLRVNLGASDGNEQLTTRVASSLREILRQMMEFIPRLDDGRLFDYIGKVGANPFAAKFEFPPSVAILLSLYYSALLIDSIVAPVSNQSSHTNTFSAILLCRVSLPSTVLANHDLRLKIRNLFLAGLILSKSLYPTGISILVYAKK
jgi:hypothetical protein